MVAGTSAGAAAGAFFCRGWSPQQMLDLVRGLSLLQLGRPSLRRPGLLDGARFEALLRSLVGDLSFADLSIPLAVVACNLLNGQRVIIREGPLAPAVRASCSIPGMFTPVELDGQVLVDGGLVDHLPVSVLRELGMDYVIGVDVHPREVRCARPRSVFDTLAACYQVMTCKSGTDPNEQADCLVRPETEGFDWLRFSSQADDLYQVGRQAALAALPQLQRDLQ
jgi:NTE family protein